MGDQADHTDAGAPPGVASDALSCTRVLASGLSTVVPNVAPVANRMTSEASVMTVRLRPVSVRDQSTSATHSSSVSKLKAPSTPLRWPKTQSSQMTVAHMGNARKRRTVSIQAPGRGIQRAIAGKLLANAYGKAKPTPSAANT